MDQLRTVFLDALNPNKDVRMKAESIIKSYQLQPGFLTQLPSFFLDQDARIRKISTIIFKNTIIRGWNEQQLTTQKGTIMSSMIDIIKITSQHSLNDITDALKYILKHEDIENWNIITEKAEHYLKARNDYKSIYASLAFYKFVFKSSKVKYKQEHANMFVKPIINDILPVLCYSCKNKMFDCVNLMVKILTYLLDSYATESPLDEINMFVQIYQTICDILQIPDFTKEIYITKKNCVKFLTKLITKAFRNTLHNQEIKEFVLNKSHFLYAYNIILETIKNEMARETEYATEKDNILKECGSFLSVIATEGKDHVEMLLNNLKFIIFGYIFPLHTLTEEIEDNFDENPKTYLRERYNYYATDAKGFALVLFTEITHLLGNKKDILNAMIKQFYDILNLYQANPNKQNACNKFACLHLLSAISDSLHENTTHIVTQYVIPDLNSPYTFLRSQASYALQFFNSSNIEINAMSFALENVINNIKNENLVVKADSVLSLTFFFSNEMIQETFKKYIPYFMQCLLDLQKNNELEAINDVLENTISNYPTEVQSHAPELVTCLCNLINKERQKINEQANNTDTFNMTNDDKLIQTLDDDKLTLFCGYLRTIDELIVADNIQKELIYKLFLICYDTLCGIFKEKIEDLYPDALQLFSDFVYGTKYMDDLMWNLFIITMSIDKDNKISNSDEFVYLIDNCISFGLHKVSKYIKIILSYVEILCNPDDGSFYDEEHINACQIMDSLFLYCKELCIEYIPFFITCAYSYYDAFDPETNVYVYNTEVIMQCFTLDFDITYRKLNEMGKLSAFVDDLYDNRHKYTRVNDKKKVMLFFMSLMTRNEDLQNVFNLKKMKKLLIKTIETLPAAIKKREKMAENKYEEIAESEENDIDDLEEDLHYESPLDHENVFETFKTACNNLGMFGLALISSIDDKDKQKIMKILNEN